MQEENTVATNRTLRTLEALLVENNQKVPFQLSGEQHSQSSKTAEESDQVDSAAVLL